VSHEPPKLDIAPRYTPACNKMLCVLCASAAIFFV
jgi:hypothetical protein